MGDFLLVLRGWLSVVISRMTDDINTNRTYSDQSHPQELAPLYTLAPKCYNHHFKQTRIIKSLELMAPQENYKLLINSASLVINVKNLLHAVLYSVI